VQPERPTVATHAHTVAPGWLEIETGGEFDRYDDASHGWQVPVTAKLGLTSHMQLTVQSGLNNPPPVTAWTFSSVSVGVKWRLADDAPLLGDFAVLPSVRLPTATGGTTDATLLLISSHTIGPFSLDVNAAYTRRSGDGTAAPRDATLWTMSWGGTVADNIGWTAELYGYPGTSGPAGQANIVALLAGPTFSIQNWLAADLGGIIPLTGPQPKAVYAGGVVNVGKIW
jgi:hypothetical protein